MVDADTPIPELLAEVARQTRVIKDLYAEVRVRNIELNALESKCAAKDEEITRLRERLERAQWLARDGDARG